MFRNCMDIMSMNGKEIAIGKKAAAFSFLSPQGGMRHSGLWRKKLLKMEIGKVKQMLRSISEKNENNPTGRQPTFCSGELSVLQAVLGELAQKS